MYVLQNVVVKCISKAHAFTYSRVQKGGCTQIIAKQH